MIGGDQVAAHHARALGAWVGSDVPGEDAVGGAEGGAALNQRVGAGQASPAVPESGGAGLGWGIWVGTFPRWLGDFPHPDLPRSGVRLSTRTDPTFRVNSLIRMGNFPIRFTFGSNVGDSVV